MKILCLLIAFLIASPAYAGDLPEGCRLLETQLNVVELRDSRRVAFNGEHKGIIAGLKAGWKARHHFYQVFGPKEYVYLTKTKDQIVTEIQDKRVPDMRKFPKQHPYWSGLGQCGQLLGVGANALGFCR